MDGVATLKHHQGSVGRMVLPAPGHDLTWHRLMIPRIASLRDGLDNNLRLWRDSVDDRPYLQIRRFETYREGRSG
jgi:hypothetical protein